MPLLEQASKASTYAWSGNFDPLETKVTSSSKALVSPEAASNFVVSSTPTGWIPKGDLASRTESAVSLLDVFFNCFHESAKHSLI